MKKIDESFVLSFILKNVGILDRRKMAKELNISVSTLKRIAYRNKINFPILKKYDDSLVKEIIEFYESGHDIKSTQDLYKVNIKSILETYRHKRTRKKQERWNDSSILELFKMGGLLDANSQSIYFNRPRAFGGSIRSFWIKRFGISQNRIHGLPAHIARKVLINPILIKTNFRMNKGTPQYICLWADCKKFKPPFIFLKEIINMISEYQMKLFCAKDESDLRDKVLEMISSRRS